MKKKNQIFGIVLFVGINLGLITVSQYLLGCGGSSPDPIATVCVAPTSVTGTSASPSVPDWDEIDAATVTAIQTCCDPATDYLQLLAAVKTNISLCTTCLGANCTGYLQSAADAASYHGNANNALSGGGNVLSGQNVITSPSSAPSATFGGTSALGASAGGSNPSTVSSNQSMKPATAQQTSSQLASGSSGLGSGGNGQFGNTGSNTPLTTSAASGGSVKVRGGATDGASTNSSIYASGQGVAPKEGATAPAFSWGNRDGGSAGSGDEREGVEVFNAAQTGGSESALLSADPADYFTRIDLNQSLFKVIHERYQSEVAQWVRKQGWIIPQSE